MCCQHCPVPDLRQEQQQSTQETFARTHMVQMGLGVSVSKTRTFYLHTGVSTAQKPNNPSKDVQQKFARFPKSLIIPYTIRKDECNSYADGKTDACRRKLIPGVRALLYRRLVRRAPASSSYSLAASPSCKVYRGCIAGLLGT